MRREAALSMKELAEYWIWRTGKRRLTRRQSERSIRPRGTGRVCVCVCVCVYGGWGSEVRFQFCVKDFAVELCSASLPLLSMV